MHCNAVATGERGSVHVALTGVCVGSIEVGGNTGDMFAPPLRSPQFSLVWFPGIGGMTNDFNFSC